VDLSGPVTSGEAIGFAGVERISPTLWEEGGICLGPGSEERVDDRDGSTYTMLKYRRAL